MITIVINGQSFDYPETGDTEWGSSATIAFQALASTTLQQEGGNFYISNELDFGGDAGIKVLFISSRTNDSASSGVFRLAKDELVAWRNEDNDGDNTISFDSDGDLIVNGVKVTLHGQIVNDDIAAAAGIEESKLALDHSTQSLYDNIENHKSDTANPHLTNLVNLVDTTIVTPADNDTLLYDGNDSKWKNIPNTVSNVKDVTISSIADGDVLVYDSNDSDWKNSDVVSSHVANTSNPHSVTKAQVLTGDLIVNADVDASAAIVESKLALDHSTDSLNTAITSHTGNTSNPHSTTVANLTDTTITSATNGDVLSYDGSKWINSPSTSSSLSGLSDTAITTPTDGDVLVYDSVSTKWENSDQLSTLDSTVSSHVANTSNPHSTNISNLTDTTITSVADKDTLIYDGNSSKWVNVENSIDNLSNVDIDSNTLTENDVMVFNDQTSKWENSQIMVNHIGNAANPHLTTVAKLTDAEITSATNKDTLIYDSNDLKWKNRPNSVDNLSNVTITTATSGDTLSYNGSGWVNQANSLDNLTNATITTPTSGQVLTYTGSIWENAAPSSGALGNITDVTITSPTDKQLLQYDNANSIWVNSSDVWSTIEVNDIANINTAVTDVTLTASDKRHQIFTTTQGFDVTLPSTGVSAGEKFVFSFEPSSGDYYSTTSFCFKASDDSIINYAHNSKFEYIFTAKINSPVASTDWFFSWRLVKRMTLEGHMDATVSSTANVPTAHKYTDRFTIFAGYWDVFFAGGVTPALNNNANIYSGIVLIYSDAGPVQSLTTSERIGVMQCVYVPRTSVDGSSFAINGTNYLSRTMLPTSMSGLAEVPYRSKAVTFFTRMVTISSSSSNQVTATAVANLVAPYTASI